MDVLPNANRDLVVVWCDEEDGTMWHWLEPILGWRLRKPNPALSSGVIGDPVTITTSIAADRYVLDIGTGRWWGSVTLSGHGGVDGIRKDFARFYDISLSS